MSRFSFDYTRYQPQLVLLLRDLLSQSPTKEQYHRVIKRYPKPNGDLFSKDQVITAYRALAGKQQIPKYSDEIVRKLQMKPVRTQSGVTPVTVLTKPFPCPGKCIFCPNDIRMPKSYLSDEPGAQRAERNFFDPYLQTYNRLQALDTIGHTMDKVEIIILGGTWSYYPESYQIWFIKECFRALNDFGQTDGRAVLLSWYEHCQEKITTMGKQALSDNPKQNKQQFHRHEIDGETIQKTYNQTVSELYIAPEKILGLDDRQTATWAELENVQKQNETAAHRCVGLVIETRPDNISEAEVLRIRRLGCTKTQIGFQSLQDSVLTKNHRGHDVAATRKAVQLLRQAGFKIHAHWMANLYGSSVKLDQKDYELMFSDPDFKPDEVKIYPCSLLPSAELMQFYQAGHWQPYSESELLSVVTHALVKTPRYCRITRVIRDIPSTDIVTGNKKTNFRQIAEQNVKKLQQQLVDIRSREVKQYLVDWQQARIQETWYDTTVSKEVFIECVAPADDQEKLLGFLRLSLPKKPSFIAELQYSAVIREIHVYGATQAIGSKQQTQVQHHGLGTQLLSVAESISQDHAYADLAVISAVGTREYYRKRGFSDGELYQHKKIA